MTDEYWRALDNILSWPDPPARLPRPERLRPRLQTVVRRVAGAAAKAEAIDRLRRLAGGEPPADAFVSPAELAGDAAYARCCVEQGGRAAELLAMRGYLQQARPGPQMRDLRIDHATTAEQLSFVTLLTEPHRFASMGAAFEAFRDGYAAAYERHHRRYWDAFARLKVLLEEAAPKAQALARLNTLQTLGRPVGVAALAAYRRLARAPKDCRESDLAAALQAAPLCRSCGVTMEDGPPAHEVEEVLRRLQQALARQQARLAGEAVRRVLARGRARPDGRPPERVEQFLQVAQAADVAGLVQALDDDVLAFLDELLAEPLNPGPEALALLDRLVREHPVVGEEQVERAVETVRRLLIERIESERAADPSRPAVVHLAAQASTP